MTVDRFGPDELRELLAPVEPPAVSIYLATDRRPDRIAADRTRFRGAIEAVRARLEERVSRREAAPLLEGLRSLHAHEEFWRRRADGLAAFASSGFRRVYRLPLRFEERVEVGDTFHTKPLLRYLQEPTRYWVLFLSEDDVRLWEGSASGLRRVQPPDLPGGLVPALGYEVERDDKFVLTRRKSAGEHGTHGRGGVTPVFHGHGVGVDDREAELRAFFRGVDETVRAVLAEREDPVVLAAVEEHQPLYREVSELAGLAGRGIEASVRDWSDERLHEAAWPIARREAAKRVDRALSLWESVGPDKIEGDPAAVARLAVAGRVRLLLVEEGRTIPGRVDRTSGALRFVEETPDASVETADLLDELSELVLLRRGDVLVVPRGRMPVGTGVAAILR